MECSKCNVKLSENTKYCPYCGLPLYKGDLRKINTEASKILNNHKKVNKNSNSSINGEVLKNTTNNNVSKGSKNNINKKLILIVSICLILLTILIILLFASKISYSSSKNNTVKASNELTHTLENARKTYDSYKFDDNAYKEGVAAIEQEIHKAEQLSNKLENIKEDKYISFFNPFDLISKSVLINGICDEVKAQTQELQWCISDLHSGERRWH